MDGDPVTEEPSPDGKQLSLAEIFVKLCPSYMAMGMTYGEFWDCNTKVHKAVREAFEIRRRNEEWARWRQGAYVYDALMRVAPVMRAALGKGEVKPGKYPEEPWPLTAREAREREQEQERRNYERALAQRRAASQREKERRQQREIEEASKHGCDD